MTGDKRKKSDANVEAGHLSEISVEGFTFTLSNDGVLMFAEGDDGALITGHEAFGDAAETEEFLTAMAEFRDEQIALGEWDGGAQAQYDYHHAAATAWLDQIA